MKFQAHYFGGTRLVSPYGANSTLQKKSYFKWHYYLFWYFVIYDCFEILQNLHVVKKQKGIYYALSSNI